MSLISITVPPDHPEFGTDDLICSCSGDLSCTNCVKFDFHKHFYDPLSPQNKKIPIFDINGKNFKNIEHDNFQSHEYLHDWNWD